MLSPLLSAYPNSPRCHLVLSNAAESFQGLADEVLRGLSFTFAYIDDKQEYAEKIEGKKEININLGLAMSECGRIVVT